MNEVTGERKRLIKGLAALLAGAFGAGDGLLAQTSAPSLRPECPPGLPANICAQRGFESRTASPHPSAGTAVEIFGLQMGMPPNWPRCSGWAAAPSDRPCVHFYSSSDPRVGLWFDLRSQPVMLTRYNAVSGYLLNGQLERLRIVSIHREDEHLQAFEQKFGAAKREQVPMQNSTGGSWTGVIHRWEISGTLIEIDCTSFEPRCVVEVTTPVWRQRDQQQQQQRQRL
jgi:hypothetical protein